MPTNGNARRALTASPTRARGMIKLACAAGLSRESLYKALRRTGNPGLDTVLRVAKAVGVRLRAEAA